MADDRWPGEEEATREIRPTAPSESNRAADLRQVAHRYGAEPSSLVALAILEVSAAIDRLTFAIQQREGDDAWPPRKPND